MKTVNDLAGAINVDRSTISRAISLGKIRAVFFGRLIRIPSDEYDRVVRDGLPKAEAANGNTPSTSGARKLSPEHREGESPQPQPRRRGTIKTG